MDRIRLKGKGPDFAGPKISAGTPVTALIGISLVSDLLPLNRSLVSGGCCWSVSAW
jgi:hypothetical protein